MNIIACTLERGQALYSFQNASISVMKDITVVGLK